jgi:hypothetical protein
MNIVWGILFILFGVGVLIRLAISIATDVRDKVLSLIVGIILFLVVVALFTPMIVVGIGLL